MHLLCDIVSFVRTWMRLMMCYMFVLHVDAPMNANVILWFLFMDVNVYAMQSFWFFI